MVCDQDVSSKNYSNMFIGSVVCEEGSYSSFKHNRIVRTSAANSLEVYLQGFFNLTLVVLLLNFLFENFMIRKLPVAG